MQLLVRSQSEMNTIPETCSVRTVSTEMATLSLSSLHRRYANETDDWPDIQLLLTSYGDNADGGLLVTRAYGLTDDYYDAMYKNILDRKSYMVLPLLLRPQSRGRIRLKNGNPYEHPLIYPNYFHHPNDIKVLVSTQVCEIGSFGGGHWACGCPTEVRVLRYTGTTVHVPVHLKSV